MELEEVTGSKLTQARADAIVASLKRGVFLDTAAMNAGVNVSTVYGWRDIALKLRSARHEIESTDDEPTPLDEWFASLTSHERNCWQVLEAVEQARAYFENFAVNKVIEAGTQGLTYATEFELGEDGQLVRDSNGELIPTAFATTSPDVKHLEWYLERTNYQRYGRRQALEVMGEGGGPVQINTASPRDRIAQKLELIEQRESALKAAEEADIVDAEIIEFDEASEA